MVTPLSYALSSLTILLPHHPYWKPLTSLLPSPHTVHPPWQTPIHLQNPAKTAAPPGTLSHTWGSIQPLNLLWGSTCDTRWSFLWPRWPISPAREFTQEQRTEALCSFIRQIFVDAHGTANKTVPSRWWSGGARYPGNLECGGKRTQQPGHGMAGTEGRAGGGGSLGATGGEQGLIGYISCCVPTFELKALGSLAGILCPGSGSA